MLLVLLNEEERFKEESKWNCDLVFSDVFFFFCLRPRLAHFLVSKPPPPSAPRRQNTKGRIIVSI